VLYANSLTREGIGPARCIPYGENSARAGFQIFIHRNPTVHLQTSLFCQVNRRSNAHTENNEISLNRLAAG
jgi:hypothetical protein